MVSYYNRNFGGIIIRPVNLKWLFNKILWVYSSGHKRRALARGDKKSLTRSLEELRQKINDDYFNNSSIAPCALTNGVIKQLVGQAKFIFSLEDVAKVITRHDDMAKRVLKIFAEEFGAIDEEFENTQMEIEIFD